MSVFASRMMSSVGVGLLQLILLSQAWADPSIETVAPDEARRNRVTTVTLTGQDLGAVTTVSASGDRVEVNVVGVSETEVTIEVIPGNRALAGLRHLLISFSDSEDLTKEDAFSVVPGEPEIFGLDPNELARGTVEAEVRLQGLNLDTITEMIIGPGITVSAPIVDASDPTRATTTITVDDTAASGPAAVTVNAGETASSTLNDGFTATPGNLEVAGVDPNEAIRGETLSINITGKNLDLITSVQFGHAVSLDELVLIDPTQMTATVSIREESTPLETAREVTFLMDGGELRHPEAFTVNAGTFAVTRIRPDRLTQGASVEMTVEGRNLDGLSSFDGGTGIIVRELTPLSAITALLSLSVDSDAELGVRDVTIEGTYGSQTIQEALQIQERVIAPPMVNFPSVTDVGSVEVGARRRSSLLFINQGEVDESIELEIVGGDIGDFRFHNPDASTLDELNPSTLLYELPAAGEGIVRIEFRPSLRASSMATVDVRIRGERVGGITLRGTGTETTLHFNPPPPVSVPLVEEGDTGFKQVTTISDLIERVVVEGVEIHVERNDGAFPEGADLTTVTFSEPLPPEEAYLFGVSLFAIETDFPAGAYEGEIWILTDRATAPIVPLTFFTTVTPAPDAEGVEGDGADVAEPTVADSGLETGNDMGTDATTDGTVADVVADGGEDTVEGEATPPPEEGCCSQGGAARYSPVAPLVLLLPGLLLWVRRFGPVS